MAVKQKFLSSDGTKENIFYPITDTNAVYDKDGNRLTETLTPMGIYQLLGYIPAKKIIDSWTDIKECEIKISNTGNIDNCYNYIGGSAKDLANQNVNIETRGNSWGSEKETNFLGIFIENGNIIIYNVDDDRYDLDPVNSHQKIDISKQRTISYNPITKKYKTIIQ